jgi:hypothetical protein
MFAALACALRLHVCHDCMGVCTGVCARGERGLEPRACALCSGVRVLLSLPCKVHVRTMGDGGGGEGGARLVAHTWGVTGIVVCMLRGASCRTWAAFVCVRRVGGGCVKAGAEVCGGAGTLQHCCGWRAHTGTVVWGGGACAAVAGGACAGAGGVVPQVPAAGGAGQWRARCGAAGHPREPDHHRWSAHVRHQRSGRRGVCGALDDAGGGGGCSCPHARRVCSAGDVGGGVGGPESRRGFWDDRAHKPLAGDWQGPDLCIFRRGERLLAQAVYKTIQRDLCPVGMRGSFVCACCATACIYKSTISYVSSTRYPGFRFHV